MKRIRKPNGAERSRLYSNDLLDMTEDGVYYLVTTARTLRAAQMVVGTTPSNLPDNQRIIVHGREGNTWKFMLV